MYNQIQNGNANIQCALLAHWHFNQLSIENKRPLGRDAPAPGQPGGTNRQPTLATAGELSTGHGQQLLASPQPPPSHPLGHQLEQKGKGTEDVFRLSARLKTRATLSAPRFHDDAPWKPAAGKRKKGPCTY